MLVTYRNKFNCLSVPITHLVVHMAIPTGAPTIPTNTDDIVEGSKIIFFPERVDDRVKDLLVAGPGSNLFTMIQQIL